MARRILIVDDDAALANAERAILEEEGYKVLYAADGTEAVDVLSRESVDLVLLDISMPNMDGYQVCHWVRQNPDTARLNILMITARGLVEEMVTGLDAGADDYLSKPFEVPEFLARVRAQLRLRELQDRLVALEKSATIGQMVITLSHEINNPLTSILWHAGLVKDRLEEQPSVDEDIQRSLRAIEDEARRIERVMAQLRSMEKPVVSEYLPGMEMIDIHRSESDPAPEI
jgi:DNA-binding response OmpR family regulator